MTRMTFALTLTLGLTALAAIVAAGPAGRQSTSPAAAQQPGSPAAATQPQAASAAVDGTFAPGAFPPTLPDTAWHNEGWVKNDCLRCHETGVGLAPVVRHAGMSEILLTAKCRTCHVVEPGKKPSGVRKPTPEELLFAENAFPPMIPASDYHRNAWTNSACRLCHESGNKDAPIVRHAGMSPVLLTAKCRSCHVQARGAELSGP